MPAISTDATLDRSYDYDQVGRLQISFTGSAVRAHMGIGSSWLSDGPYAVHDNVYDVWGNLTSREGWGGVARVETQSYSNNRQAGVEYDAAGNLRDGNRFIYNYDATGQQTRATCPGYSWTNRTTGIDCGG